MLFLGGLGCFSISILAPVILWSTGHGVGNVEGHVQIMDNPAQS